MSPFPIVELELEAMAHGGEAMGRWEGRVVFVPGAIPGEVVRAQLVEERKSWARGSLLRVLRASPQRVEPPCPYFGRCGGCQWQHMAYPAQVAHKRAIVADQLRRLGRILDPPVGDAIGMAEPWSYRNHVQFAVGADGRLGFQAAQSHDVVRIARCLLLHPLLDELHAALDVAWPGLRRLSLRAGVHTEERMCVLEGDGAEVPEVRVDPPSSVVLRRRGQPDRALAGSTALHEVLRGRRFRVSASSFFQVNTAQAEAMLDLVEAYLEPEAGDVVLDLYCGVGTMGLSVCGGVRQVIGVEEHPAAVADARANAGQDGRVRLIEGRAEEVLPGLQEGVTKAILDPPRQGIKPEAMRALLRMAPRRIVYVSCDPATLARDAALLVEKGYRLAQVRPVDMFPQTYHIETVSLWLGAA